jgi:hypothetical protein
VDDTRSNVTVRLNAAEKARLEDLKKRWRLENSAQVLRRLIKDASNADDSFRSGREVQESDRVEE